MMNRRSFLYCYLFSIAGCAAATSQHSRNTFHAAETHSKTLRFAVADAHGMEELQRDYEPFRVALEEVLETKIEFVPLDSFTAAGSALQLHQIDFAFVGASEYVIIKARTNASLIIALTRPGFRSVIAVRKTSNIKSLAQLKGKTIAMREIGSLGGHLSPTKLLFDAGLKAQSDFKILMLGENGIKALKNGEVDAWGGSIFRYQRSLDAKNITEKDFPIIATGPILPNDIFIASSKLDPALVEQMRSRMLKNQDKLIAALLSTKISSTRFQGSKLVPANDADYNIIRETYRALGQGNFLN